MKSDVDYSSRLLLTFVLAGVGFVAAERSAFMIIVASVAWVAATIHLFTRFGWRAGWALVGAPVVFYWAIRMATYVPSSPTGAPVPGPGEILV